MDDLYTVYNGGIHFIRSLSSLHFHTGRIYLTNRCNSTDWTTKSIITSISIRCRPNRSTFWDRFYPPGRKIQRLIEETFLIRKPARDFEKINLKDETYLTKATMTQGYIYSSIRRPYWIETEEMMFPVFKIGHIQVYEPIYHKNAINFRK